VHGYRSGLAIHFLRLAPGRLSWLSIPRTRRHCSRRNDAHLRARDSAVRGAADLGVDALPMPVAVSGPVSQARLQAVDLCFRLSCLALWRPICAR
jgi:hypothetical protein